MSPVIASLIGAREISAEWAYRAKRDFGLPNPDI